MSGNSEISGNKGGVYMLLLGGGTVTITENARIRNNTKDGYGGGLCIDGKIASPSVTTVAISGNASISGNTAEKGGGLYIAAKGSVSISGNAVISGNTAKNSGGGVFVVGRLTQEGGTISGNKAEFVGGGVYADLGAVYNARGGKVTGNTAGDGGDNVFIRQ
jgi:predicted outer membrane repeat protein